MIRAELLSAGALKIIVPEKLEAGDFQQLAPQIDSLIRERGTIRLLIDATRFAGWENMEALEKHVGFIKDHQQKVERIAVITAHDWQRWVIATIRLFVHPEVRAYDKRDAEKALQWIA